MLQLKLAHVWSQRRYHFVRAMHYSLYVLGARHYHLCYYIKCFSVSSNDLWPVSSSRTLERRGNTYTQRKPPPNSQNSSTQPSFCQYFIFHGGTGRNHKLFFWRALLSSKGDLHQQRLILLPIACSSLSLPICTLSSNE